MTVYDEMIAVLNKRQGYVVVKGGQAGPQRHMDDARCVVCAHLEAHHDATGCKVWECRCRTLRSKELT